MIDTLLMAIRGLAAHKLRSLLTLSGIVIGITAVVGMSAVIRGIDLSISGGIRAMNPNVVYLDRIGARITLDIEEWLALDRRPDLTMEDLKAIERSCPTVGTLDVFAGQNDWHALKRGKEKSRNCSIMGVGENYLEVNNMRLQDGRFFTSEEAARGTRVMVMGAGPVDSLMQHVDPIGKRVRLEGHDYLVIGTLVPQADVGGFNMGQDNFAVIPIAAHMKDLSGRRQSLTIAMVPREGATPEAMKAEVIEFMRVRHALRAHEENDFDLMTQESILQLWRDISDAVFYTLLAISSIALAVGGIGVMAVMLVAVTERTREIGVRRAIGARRGQVMLQFLAEAAMLTALGGAIGSLVGAGAAWGIGELVDLPVAMPWDTFAIAIAGSTLIGIVFGVYPAHRAAKVDPIVALRYE